jgi:GT2 family glycosyltransferase
MIAKFDIEAFLTANDDLGRKVESGEIADIREYLEKDGYREISDGERPFHFAFEPYDDELYALLFPSVVAEVERGTFETLFDHFATHGYFEIVSEKKRQWFPKDTNPATSPLHIFGFNYQAFEMANPDIMETMRKEGHDNLPEYMYMRGFASILKGERPFHPLFEPFDEKRYLEIFDDVREAVAKGVFKSGYEHFRRTGYKEIVTLRKWPMSEVARNPKEPMQEKRDTNDIEEALLVVTLGESIPSPMLNLFTSDASSLVVVEPRRFAKSWPLEDIESLSPLPDIHGENGGYRRVVLFCTSTRKETLSSAIESLKNISGRGAKSVRSIVVLPGDFQKCGSPHILDSYRSVVDSFDMESVSLVSRKVIDGRDRRWMTDTLSFLSGDVRAGFPEDTPFGEFSPPVGIEDGLELFCDEMRRLDDISANYGLLGMDGYAMALYDAYFDAEYYLDRYGDIRRAKIDPALHYLKNGWREDRSPTPYFDNRLYRLDMYDDGSTVSFIHYLVIGRYYGESTWMPDIGSGELVLPNPDIFEGEIPILKAPSFDETEVSILIPAFNNMRFTLSAISSVIEHSDGVAYEIVVLDDASDDGISDGIDRYLEGIEVVKNEKNLGFLRNCNQGAEKVSSEYIVLLNSDTAVQPGWLVAMLETMKRDPSIGLVGPKYLYPDGKLQEAGGIVWRDASAWNYGHGDYPGIPAYNYLKECDYISGASIMIRKSLWDEIGGFDERYAPAYYEDTDLAFEVRKRGYRVVYQPKSKVVHYEGISHGKDESAGIKRYQEINREKFLEKWRDTLQREHAENAEDPFTARDRSASRPHMLYVDQYAPTYDMDAGSKAALHYLRELRDMGFAIHFIGDSFSQYPGDRYLDELLDMGIEVLYGRWCERNWKRWLEENGKYIGYAVLSRPDITARYIDAVGANSTARILYCAHDLHFFRELREMEVKGVGEKKARNVERRRESELSVMRKADISCLFSSAEKREMERLDPSISTEVVPLYIYDTFRDDIPPLDGRRDIVFVGGFMHNPNVDAVLWFVLEVWPILKEKIPDLRFHIAGSNPTPVIEALESEDMVVTGYISDDELKRLYDSCMVAVAPLRYGAGIKGKVVDALYNGVPLVTTTIGAEGLESQKPIMEIADEAMEFADAVVRLYRDRDRADELRENAMEYCVENFSSSYARKRLETIFHQGER